MQAEANWLQKPLHYTKIMQYFKHFQSCNSSIRMNFIKTLMGVQQI